jgi:hypothetical protein
MKPKKHLSFSSLRKLVSSFFKKLDDKRRKASTFYAIHDAIMSAFACMFFQDPSLLQFQKNLHDSKRKNNLNTIFGVQNIPSSNQIKDILDEQDSSCFRPIFKAIIQRLQRGKQLATFQLFKGWTICSIDATQYFSSKLIHCKKCLVKTHADKTKTYQHFALQAALMHPDSKQVIPIMVEPIQNSDGTIKQDCETNAAKRLIPQLKKDYPKLGLIVTGDDLFSRQPTIELVLLQGFYYFFVAKPKSHKYMMAWLEAYDTLPELRVTNKNGTTYLYQWMNDIPLHGGKKAIQVNYFQLKKLKKDANGNEVVYSTQGWVTDFKITEANVVLCTKGAKTRWKIENECFNTLKNQGYHLTHNYGHGEDNLSFNFYILTLLAFFFHQIFELCDPLFKECRKSHGSKRHLWETLRSYIKLVVFKNWEQLLLVARRPIDFRITLDVAGPAP